MRRYSPPHRSPPRRHGGRGRSPPRRGYGGRKDQSSGSLLVRNIPLNCRPDELRVPFERYGPVRDIYLPRDYYTGEPRGFAFVEFVDPYDASEAQYKLNHTVFAGREITVVLAAESRKRPEEMRRRDRVRGYSGHDGRRGYHGRSRSRSVSRSRSPRHRARPRSRSRSPAPRRREDHSGSPRREPRHAANSPGRKTKERNDRNIDVKRRSTSPVRGRRPPEPDNGYEEKPSSPIQSSGSPPGSRSRSADQSPSRSK